MTARAKYDAASAHAMAMRDIAGKLRALIVALGDDGTRLAAAYREVAAAEAMLADDAAKAYAEVAPTLVAVSDEELAEAFDKGRGVLPRDPHACLAGIRAVRDKLGAAEVTEERVKAALCEHFKYEGHRDWSADARAILAYLRATAAKGG